MKITSVIFLASVCIFGGSLVNAHIFGQKLITPVFSAVKPMGGDERQIALGRDLFFDNRLSVSTHMRCASCHNLSVNGASGNPLDRMDSGQLSPFNTPTIFNSVFNYRFGWAARDHSNRDEVMRNVKSYLGSGSPIPMKRLQTDPALVERFRAIYGRRPDDNNVADALTWFISSLVTPDARFDRWLDGDAKALTPQQAKGYQSFLAVGCSGCHQGRNIGGNLSEPVKGVQGWGGRPINTLRVPSLRNVAVTAPYFHDGRTSVLETAVRQCAMDRLGSNLSRSDIRNISAFLKALTGSYQGRSLRSMRSKHD